MGVGEAGDVAHAFNPNTLKLGLYALVVVDHIIRPQLIYPLLAFITTGGGNDNGIGFSFSQLNHHAAHPAGRTCD